MLRTVLPGAGGEAGGVALIGGEAGSGKTRLVRELAGRAAADGVLVLYGACDAVVRTPYGPFISALEHLGRVTEPDVLRADLGAAGGELTRLLPDLPARVGELPHPFSGHLDSERHRLHTAVAGLLVSASRRHPLMIVVEDAHWADGSTLLLLRHLARVAADASILLLATFRDTPAEMPSELSESLVDLRRAEGVLRVRLCALTDQDVADFVRHVAGRDLDPALEELAQAVSELTGGNAFLMIEVWRTLMENGALETGQLARSLSELGSPQTVREVVAQRLTRVAPETTEFLDAAAVVGPEFTLDVVGGAADLDERALLRGLDEAMRSGIVEEILTAGLAHRFTHELVRRAIYDRLTALRRAELHLRVGMALEVAAAVTPARRLADLAHHFAAAVPLGDLRRAVDYNLRAARSAMATLAFEHAADHLRTALTLGIERPDERAQVHLELGAACHRAGISIEAIEAFTSAAEIARDLGGADVLARAAIGLEEACWRPGIAQPRALELLEEALAAMDAEESSLRVGLLTALTRVFAYRGDHERAAIMRANAIGMARRLGDLRGLANLFAQAYWARGTNTLEEVLETLTEASDLADELGDLEIRDIARAWRVITYIALGEVDAARRDLAAMLDVAGQTKEPFWLSTAEHIGATIALCEGRLEEAATRAERSRGWQGLLSGGDASGIHGIQMFSIRREQGRLAELAPVVRVLAADEGSAAAWRPGLVALLVELEMEDAARHELGWVRTHGLEPFREALWLASLTYLADACAAVGDGEVARLVRAELEPHAGSIVVVGYGVACYGAADRYLGMLASTLHEWDVAEIHFASAMETNRQMGASTWLAHTAYEFARMLFVRGRLQDAGRADSMLHQAAVLAEQIGMPALLSRIRTLASPLARADQLPDGLSPREVEILRLVSRGLSNRQIGSELFISEHTAANHMRSILRKTSCANRTEAAGYAHRHGLAIGLAER